MNNLKVERRQIAPLFRKMNIGDSELYPSVQSLAIQSTRNRLQLQYPPIKFSVTKVDDYTIKVTRVA